jgi:hypothetical protein
MIKLREIKWGYVTHMGDAYFMFYSDPEDGGSTFLRNVGRLLPDYTALYSRRENSS